MKLTFLGAAHEVTGSCTLLEACGKKILIDCGMEQGADLYDNQQLPVTPGEIDAIFLTHAHIDHSGKLPMMTAGGFFGHIYATEATVQLCNIMLADSAHIQEFEASWRNRKAQRSGKPPYVPLYTMQDVQKTLPKFVGCRYEEPIDVLDCFHVRFIDAGHLLGSSSIELSFEEYGHKRSLLFSGDLGNVKRPLIHDPIQPPGADYVIIESTYGTRFHGERPDYRSQLAAVIQRTLDRGGNVVIPSFAVGRTQELLYLLREIKEAGMVHGHDHFPVYVDSPLAVEATNIYSGDLHDYFDADTLALLEKGIHPLKFPDLHFSVRSEESVAINADPEPKVILSASGMCEAGRIRHHLKHNLWRKESTILFVGYQAEGTLGRSLIEGRDEVKLFGETVAVRAEIAQMAGISGHADQEILLHWLKGFSHQPLKVFVNHGNDEVCDEFARIITKECGYAAEAPYSGSVYDLYTGDCLAHGNRKRLEQSAATTDRRPPSNAYSRLLAAGKRLLQVIEKNRHGSNKNLAKFESQIQNLCDKWDD